jgi:hypothetical protein
MSKENKTKEFNAQNFKCRCSAINKMMANKQGYEPLTEKQEQYLKDMEEKAALKPLAPGIQSEVDRLYVKKEMSKKIILSDSCIEYLMIWYAWETEQMIPVDKESMDILSMSKGRKQEAQAGALLNFVDGVEYKVHKDRISNDFLTGEIDLYMGDDVYNAHTLPDIKNAWDYPGYLKKINNGLENGQEEQLQGYGDITGARNLFVANCLVDCTEQNIDEVKWRVTKKFDAATTESPEFLKEWAKWERSMRFNHIDPYKRVHKIPVEPFTEFQRQKVYDKVKICRDWLHEFDERFQKMNKCQTNT